MRSAATSATASMPGSPTAAPASSSICSGFAALKLGWVEGVEVDLLGLVAGLDLRHPGVKLPGFGRIGLESPVATALAR